MQQKFLIRLETCYNWLFESRQLFRLVALFWTLLEYNGVLDSHSACAIRKFKSSRPEMLNKNKCSESLEGFQGKTRGEVLF